MPFTSLGLAPELVRAVADEGYEQPTPIQQEAIPLALAGRDLIGSAQTGTGKTAAFMLPILQRLSRNGVKNVLRALILVPTRELAEQVLQSARTYGRDLDVSAAAIYGGVGMEPQTRALARGTDIGCDPGPLARSHGARPRGLFATRSAGTRRGRPHARHGIRARRAPHPAGAPLQAADDALLGDGVARGGCARAHGARQPRLRRDRATGEARGRDRARDRRDGQAPEARRARADPTGQAGGSDAGVHPHKVRRGQAGDVPAA